MKTIQELNPFVWDKTLEEKVRHKTVLFNQVGKEGHGLHGTISQSYRWEELTQHLQIHEAISSSEIEGIDASFEEVLFSRPDQDTLLARNLRDAHHFGVERMKTAPLNMELIKDAHCVLFEGSGLNPNMGKTRTVMVRIGGHRPPRVSELPTHLAELDEFLRTSNLPTLIKAAVAHAQFEMIHPFEDGNGRTGRLLIQLIMRELIPVFPMSVEILQRRPAYYSHLDKCGSSPDWSSWINAFLEWSDEILDQLLEAYKSIGAYHVKIRQA